MVSGFACDCWRFITSVYGLHKSYKIIAPGKNAGGFWTCADLVKQFDEVVDLFN